MECNSAWARALHIDERSPDAAPLPAEEDSQETARLRVEKWREIPPFIDSQVFTRRLLTSNLSLDHLAALLAEDESALASRLGNTPSWWRTVTSAYTQAQSSSPEPAWQVAVRGSAVASVPHSCFLASIDPLLEYVGEKIEARFGSPRGADLRRIALRSVAFDLLCMIERPLVVELHSSRIRGELDGATPEGRFRSFVQRIATPAARESLLCDYPGLARRIWNYLNSSVDAFVELVSRLYADERQLRQTFGIPSLDTLDDVSLAGDPHSGARRTSVLKFRNGERLVYKPRSLGTDAFLGSIIALWNEGNRDLLLRLPGIMECSGYGWSQYISHAPSSPTQVPRFYRKIGVFSALFYALKGVDFHFENVVAAGEDPFFIDLECLLHRDFPRPDSAAHHFAETRGNTVLTTNIYPLSAGGDAYVDPSALAVTDKTLFNSASAPLRSGTDRMAMGRSVSRPTLRHIPLVQGGDYALACDHQDSIEAGFRDGYAFLLGRGARVLELAMSKPELAVRCVPRPTAVYSRVLKDSYHPHCYFDALEHDRVLDALWVGLRNNPLLEQIIPSEREALMRGDIPVFTTKIGTCDMFDDCGRVVARFENTALEELRRSVSRLSLEDCERQVHYIVTALSLTRTPVKRDGRPSRRKAPSTSRAGYRSVKSESRCSAAAAVGQGTFGLAAKAIGETLRIFATEDDRYASWIGLHGAKSGAWRMQLMPQDLYRGIAGVALFLAYLGRVCADEQCVELARKATHFLIASLDEEGAEPIGPGLYDGWAGIAYSLWHIGHVLDAEWIRAVGGECVQRAIGRLTGDTPAELATGLAGVVGVLLMQYECSKDPKLLLRARELGRRIVDMALPQESGVGWISPVCPVQPIVGFAHGNAGITWVLVRLYLLTQERVFLESARRGMAYERSLYDVSAGNWRQLRTGGGGFEQDFVHTWCYGPPGIGMGRLAWLQAGAGEEHSVIDEVRTAVRLTKRFGFGHSHCLCHGDAGSLEFLLEASRVFDPTLAAVVSSQAERMVVGAATNGWQCGLPFSAVPEGLFVGLSGIGLCLLRLEQPERVPSVLLLAPPPS